MKDLPQFVWPLIGVLLGWLLSAVSSGWKSREERRRVAGKLLTALLDVRSDVRTLKVVSGQMKGLIEKPKEYEDFRQHIYSKYFLESSGGASEISKLISELSGYRPIAAYELHSAMKLLSRSKGTTLSATSSNADAYEKLLAVHELGLRLVEKQLTNVVRSLALDHGVLTRARLILKLRKEGKVGPSNEAFIGKIGRETLGAIKMAPDPSTTARPS